ncbi:BA14K family protein [Bradyrhizobium sp.]|uniref:BA14K family protein n=1 Tax=Bradyrhizobium sp. TaxID=376 RepID=UPI003C734C1C
MAGLKTLVATALISAISATSALAQEPAAFQSMFPNRDVLNGGALTPAGRMALEQPGGAAAANNAYAGTGGAGGSVRAQRYRSYDPATDTFLGVDGRRHRVR